jgi:hypothetical protein
MKFIVSIIILLMIQWGLSGYNAIAHPAAGIIIDKFGNVYFIYSRVGVVKVSPDGKLSYIHKTNDGHWLCIDEQGFFSRTQPKYFERITPDGVRPAIIYAGGGSPIVINRDGNFYYCGGQRGDLQPGAKTLVRETPGNQQIIFAPALENKLDELNDGITGLAAAPDSSVFAAGWNSILKVTMDGKVTTLVHPVIINNCDEDPADHKEINRGNPLLRGIAVDSIGTLYLAATSCHCLIKITPDGKLKTILKSARPWSPTGVAVRNGNIYVLEYTNANGPATEGWIPRVRKIGKDGQISIIADLSIKKD